MPEKSAVLRSAAAHKASAAVTPAPPGRETRSQSQPPPKTPKTPKTPAASRDMEFVTNTKQKRKESVSTWTDWREGAATYEVFISSASTYLSVQEYAKAIEHYTKVFIHAYSFYIFFL